MPSLSLLHLNTHNSETSECCEEKAALTNCHHKRSCHRWDGYRRVLLSLLSWWGNQLVAHHPPWCPLSGYSTSVWVWQLICDPYNVCAVCRKIEMIVIDCGIWTVNSCLSQLLLVSALSRYMRCIYWNTMWSTLVSNTVKVPDNRCLNYFKDYPASIICAIAMATGWDSYMYVCIYIYVCVCECVCVCVWWWWWWWWWLKV